MISAKELYPEAQDGDYFSTECEYQPILNEIGTIVLQKDDEDYQGDSRVLYRDGDRWGYLQFGWGSCSGCDALQGCESYEEIDKLIVFLVGTVRWFESAVEALAFFKEHDWAGDYSNSDENQAVFVADTIALLDKT